MLFARNTLITDPVERGGVGRVGAPFADAGLLTLVAIAVYWRCSTTIGGAAIACPRSVPGCALLGKTLLHV